MRWLIEYIRSLFCKHDFEYENIEASSSSDFHFREGVKVSRTCRKCGYHKSYWKY